MTLTPVLTTSREIDNKPESLPVTAGSDGPIGTGLVLTGAAAQKQDGVLNDMSGSDRSDLAPASGSGPAPAGNWPAARRCWRWCHRPAAQRLPGRRCPWRSAAARSSSGSEERKRVRQQNRRGVPALGAGPLTS